MEIVLKKIIPTHTAFSIDDEHGMFEISQGEGYEYRSVVLNAYELDWILAHGDELRERMIEPLYAGGEE